MAEVLKVISHPLRLRIIELLESEKPLCVGDILSQLDVEKSLLSHHLNKMKDKGILEAHRQGRKKYFRLAFKEITKIFDCLEQCDLF